MVDWRISEFIIALLFVTFFVTTFATFIADMGTRYGGSYDEEQFEAYNQSQELSSLVQELESGSNIKEKTGIVDIIGSYMSDAISVLKISKQSFNLFDTMSDEAIENARMGALGQHLRIVVNGAVLIIIVIGIIIAAILKWRT